MVRTERRRFGRNAGGSVSLGLSYTAPCHVLRPAPPSSALPGSSGVAAPQRPWPQPPGQWGSWTRHLRGPKICSLPDAAWFWAHVPFRVAFISFRVMDDSSILFQRGKERNSRVECMTQTSRISGSILSNWVSQECTWVAQDLTLSATSNDLKPPNRKRRSPGRSRPANRWGTRSAPQHNGPCRSPRGKSAGDNS